MIRLWSLALVVGMALVGASFALADVPPGPPPPPPGVRPVPEGTLPLVVRVDPNATVSRLILPPEAAGGDEEEIEDAAPRSAPPGAAPPREAPPEAPRGAFFESPTRSILAGLCLSLAIGAVFFIPRTGGVAQMVLIGAVGLGVAGMTAAAFADLAPPFEPPQPRPRPQPQPFVPAPGIGGGRVEVTWGGKRGAPVTLILAGRNGRPGGAGAVPGPRPSVSRSPEAPESALEPVPPPATKKVER